RFFLKSGGIGLATLGLMGGAPRFLSEFAAAQTRATTPGGKRKTLVTIFQRGAVDGLNVVVPHGEKDYYSLRPTIAVARPKSGDADTVIDLDGQFGLHPALAAFKPLWDSKRLAIIEAVGSPDNTRSHFDAQDYMESATPGVKSTRDGWLNRLIQTAPESNASPFRAVSMTQGLPRAMQGRAPAVAMSSLNDFGIRAGAATASVQGGFEAIYAQGVNDALHGTGQETFEAVNYLKKMNPAQFRPENGAVYPATPFGRAMQQIAQLIKAGVGLEIAFTDTPGMQWDTHNNEGGARGQLANLLREFSTTIAAFQRDLGQHMDDVLLVTMSEFGRTARENGSRGTDHGHANVMFVMGNGVRGGKVYGNWPGLGGSQLNEGRDLALTTDFRDVFAEVAQKHLGNRKMEKVFPGYAVDAGKFKGFLS
ncbi:MAG: DUF1501 domain-containing protein, partial [Pyrinomonadaceae bacterium]